MSWKLPRMFLSSYHHLWKVPSTFSGVQNRKSSQERDTMLLIACSLLWRSRTDQAVVVGVVCGAAWSQSHAHHLVLLSQPAIWSYSAYINNVFCGGGAEKKLWAGYSRLFNPYPFMSYCVILSHDIVTCTMDGAGHKTTRSLLFLLHSPVKKLNLVEKFAPHGSWSSAHTHTHVSLW